MDGTDLLNPALLAFALAGLMSACAYFFVRIMSASTEREVKRKLTDAAIRAVERKDVEGARVLLGPVTEAPEAGPAPTAAGMVADLIKMKLPSSPSPST